MAEHLLIRNIGPIKTADITIKKTVIFIGSQGSGKSTISKLLAVLRDIKFVLSFLDDDKNQTSYLDKYNISSYFNVDSHLEYTCDKYKIVFSGKWSVIPTSEFMDDIRKEEDRIKDLIRVVIKNNAAKNQNRETNINDGAYFNTIYNVNKGQLFDLLKKQIYIPAERTLLSLVDHTSFFYKDVPLPQSFVDFGKQFQNARTNKEHYSIDFLNIEYRFEDNKNKVYYSENSFTPLSESASGFQAIIPMMMVIDDLKWNKSSFIVEEPELNLFPKTQHDILKFLLKNINELSDLIITTHSPYLLSAANNLLFAGRIKELNSEFNLENLGDVYIQKDEFAAYYAHNGGFKSIFNEKTGLISTNELDLVSDDISGEFQYLMSEYKKLR